MQGIPVIRTPRVQVINGKPEFAQKPQEHLTGYVQGRKASTGEERMARALDGHADWYKFAVPLVAPENLPGWKQADFVVGIRGVVKTIEVDNPFTHRDKQIKDKLHDAIVLNELNNTYGDIVWPQVYRAIDVQDLVDQATANRWVRTHI